MMLDSIISHLEWLYTDRIDILYAIETNRSGRVCPEWVPVPDPCDESLCMVDIKAQFKEETGRYNLVEGREESYRYATVDIPHHYEWLTTAMRIRHGRVIWRIESIQPDMGAATRIKLRCD